MGDRPDHTGNVVIQGTVTITGAVTITGTVTITGDVNVTGGTITISSGHIIVDSGSITIQGTVNVTGSVTVIGTVTVTGTVVISSGIVNILTAAGVTVNVGGKETTCIGRSINQPTFQGSLNGLGTYWRGRFFPNGCRGHIHSIFFWLRNDSGSPITLTIGFSTAPGAPELFTTTYSVPTGAGAWREIAVAKFWEFDSLFIYTKTINTDLVLTIDNTQEYEMGDTYYSDDYGTVWHWSPYYLMLYPLMRAQRSYPVPVEGTVSVKSDGTNIIIDKLVQGAYLERDRTFEPHKNEGTSPLFYGGTIANYREGKFFPRGCRGFISNISYYTRKTTAGDVTITFSFSPYPAGPEIFTVSETLPGNTAAGWREITVRKPWSYDGLFFYMKDNLYFAYDAEDATKSDEFYSSDAGVTWGIGVNRMWYRAYIYGQTVGDLPVSGTVNNIQIPNSAASAVVAATSCPTGAETTLKTVYGAGKVLCLEFYGEHSGLEFRIYCDDVCVWDTQFSTLSTNGFIASTPGTSLTKYAAGGACTVFITTPFPFLRKFEVRVRNDIGSAKLAAIGNLAAIELLR